MVRGLSAGEASSSGGSSPYSSAGHAAKCPPALYADLLRSANGDQQLVALRLAEMGFEPGRPDEAQQQQQQSIKAVGGGGAGLAGWGSLAATLGSKDALKSKPPPPPPRGERDLDSQAAEAGAPSHFFCPISLQIMRDPVVVAATGQT